MVNLMSSVTKFDDVWVSLSLKICCPKWPLVFWEKYDLKKKKWMEWGTLGYHVFKQPFVFFNLQNEDVMFRSHDINAAVFALRQVLI